MVTTIDTQKTKRIKAYHYGKPSNQNQESTRWTKLKWNQMKPGVAILIADKIDFKSETRKLNIQWWKSQPEKRIWYF